MDTTQLLQALLDHLDDPGTVLRLLRENPLPESQWLVRLEHGTDADWLAFREHITALGVLYNIALGLL